MNWYTFALIVLAIWSGACMLVFVFIAWPLCWAGAQHPPRPPMPVAESEAGQC